MNFIYGSSFQCRHIMVNVTDFKNVQKIKRGSVQMGWLHGPAVERRSLAGEISLSCARPIADE